MKLETPHKKLLITKNRIKILSETIRRGTTDDLFSSCPQRRRPLRRSARIGIRSAPTRRGRVNPGWMIVNCYESCDHEEGYGHLIDSEVRCDPERLNSTVPAWEGGSLNDFSARWATGDEYKRYEPHVVSSPEKVHGAQ